MPQSTFRQRVGYLWPCVALASTLTDDICHDIGDDHEILSLREEASHEGLTYLQVLKYVENTELYLARVASQPALLEESNLLVFFTEEQLAYTLPVDIRLQWKCSGAIICAIKAHAATLLSVQVTYPEQQETRSEVVELILHPLAETIEVTHEDLTAAMQATITELSEAMPGVGISPTRTTHLFQQALLRAALDVLMSRLWQTPCQARSRRAQARCKLLAALQRWQEQTQQRIVTAQPHWKQGAGKVLWELIIGIPVVLVSAQPCAG
jgi:hypothetical protein